jgi:hypothetical protein
MRANRHQIPEQEHSIKAREEELYVEPKEAQPAKPPPKPFTVLLHETPAKPMSSQVKVMLWIVGILVVALFVAAIGRGQRSRRQKRPSPAPSTARAPGVPSDPYPALTRSGKIGDSRV